MYLHKIQHKLLNLNGTCVDVSTICRLLRRSGFTRKKRTLVATQRSEELRQEFKSDISNFERSALIQQCGAVIDCS